MGKRELIALLNLSSWCLMMVERLFLAMPRGCLQFVIVVFPDHTHLLFLIASLSVKLKNYYNIHISETGPALLLHVHQYIAFFLQHLHQWSCRTLQSTILDGCSNNTGCPRKNETHFQFIITLKLKVWYTSFRYDSRPHLCNAFLDSEILHHYWGYPIIISPHKLEHGWNKYIWIEWHLISFVHHKMWHQYLSKYINF